PDLFTSQQTPTTAIYTLSLHDALPIYYANAAADIEYQFPFGFKELEGIHSRTDFDLKSHQELSGKKLQYFDPETNENYIPYVLRSEEHTSELQSRENLVCRLLLEKKKK